MDRIDTENKNKIMIWNIVGAVSLFPFMYSLYFILLSFMQGFDLHMVKDTMYVMWAALWKVYIVSFISYNFAVASVNEIKETERLKFKNAIRVINSSTLLGEK